MNKLTRENIERRLPAGRRGEMICRDSVGSTNAVLCEMAKNGAEPGTVVTADTQTAGRGRLGRSFHSPGGVGLYLSYLADAGGRENAGEITAAAAVAALRALAAFGVRVKIKWVNDIIINNKKICGILAEGVAFETLRRAVVGLGFNLLNAPEDFPEEIRKKASSVLAETGAALPRAEFAARLISELDRVFSEPAKSCFSEYENACVTLGGDAVIIAPDGRYPAHIDALLPDFSLSVTKKDGARARVFYGEVAVRDGDNYC